MTTDEFLTAVGRLQCRHDHVPMFYRGFAQYTGPRCPAYMRLVAEQRETWRARR